jgi:two-component system, NtrC family, nitrogen regulation sensor histidine kinase GlnL
MTVDFARIVENLNTAILVVDGELRTVYMNPSAEVMFATSARQAAGQPARSLAPGEACFADPLERVLEEGRPYTERERQLRLPGERQVTVDCMITPLLEGQSYRALLIELLQVDRHLRIAREEHLHAQQDAMHALLRGLAHEVKNPLGGLRGAAQLLQRELPDASLREYTRIIIDEADRLRNLVDRMLGPRTPTRKRPMNIHEVVEHVRQLLLAEIPEGVTISTDYDPSIPDCLGDPEQLIQAVLNVARNAVQAVQGSGEVGFRTRIIRHQTIGQQHYKLVARIDITDNGPGVPPELIEHIFYPMVTSRAEGTGLGLTIAQALIKQHGGLIECSTRPRETTFSLLLPLENGP